MSERVHAGINISGPDGLAVRDFAENLYRLLTAPCGDQAKAEAMITMRTMCKLEHITVSNCSINMSPPPRDPQPEPPTCNGVSDREVRIAEAADPVSDAMGISREVGRRLMKRGIAKVQRSRKSGTKSSRKR